MYVNRQLWIIRPASSSSGCKQCSRTMCTNAIVGRQILLMARRDRPGASLPGSGGLSGKYSSYTSMALLALMTGSSRAPSITTVRM